MRAEAALPVRKPRAPARTAALAEAAARSTVAIDPLIGVRRVDALAATAQLATHLARQPRALGAAYARLLGESARILGGRSQLAPSASDRRFADPAWTRNGAFRRVLQSYLAVADSLERCIEDLDRHDAAGERGRFALSLLIDAVAPTNFLATNPVALRKMVDSKGASVLRGLANFVEDVATRGGLPRQVDARPFAIGRNVAATEGAVVYRNELLELIQYRPRTRTVHARPLVIVPPQINKYYVFDLAGDRSFVRWSLDSNLQTFAVSWRNPTSAQAECGFDAYVQALEQAVDVAREISGSRDVNVFGACSGGITLSVLLADLAARAERKVHSTTMAVCVLDTDALRDSSAGFLATPAAIKAAKAASRRRGVLDGAELARIFAWLRPNDLVWNYVVNNYLLGNEPPAHDILFWNSDTTRLPARLHADFLDLLQSNALVHSGQLVVRGRTIDLQRIRLDSYVIAGVTDHITPWRGVYRTARLLGGARSTFVLANAGHIQSLVNPVANARSWFATGAARAHAAERWLEGREKTAGSWWPHWREWIRARSGATRRAAWEPGRDEHRVLADAPGTYVLER